MHLTIFLISMQKSVKINILDGLQFLRFSNNKSVILNLSGSIFL